MGIRRKLLSFAFLFCKKIEVLGYLVQTHEKVLIALSFNKKYFTSYMTSYYYILQIQV